MRCQPAGALAPSPPFCLPYRDDDCARPCVERVEGLLRHGWVLKADPISPVALHSITEHVREYLSYQPHEERIIFLRGQIIEN
jgi:hypothetical protein